jgi:hypothetical protein
VLAQKFAGEQGRFSLDFPLLRRRRLRKSMQNISMRVGSNAHVVERVLSSVAA